MELELKHFTTYLHHNLKVFSLPFDCELELEGATVSHEDKIFCGCGNLMAAPGHSWFNFKENGQVMIKPILKSLANCEEVLIECIKTEFKPQNFGEFTTGQDYIRGKWIAINFTHDKQKYEVFYASKVKQFYFNNITKNQIFNVCAENIKMMEVFLDNHVDINFLIENNLAIEKSN